jgi:hypothetical protein
VTFHQSADQFESLRLEILSRKANLDVSARAKTGLPLLIIGSEVDLGLGIRYLRHVTPATEFNVLLKGSDDSLVRRLKHEHPDFHIAGVFRTSQLGTANGDLLLGILDRYQALNPAERQRMRPVLSLLIRSIANALALEELTTALKPEMLFGTMEKSPIGASLSCIKRSWESELISYQHGIMSLTDTMGLLQFDRFLVWNDSFKQLVRQDGYPDEAVIEVLDRRARPATRPTLVDRVSIGLAGTRGVYFEQPLLKSPYSIAEYRNMLSELSGLAARYGFELDVKPHPRTYGVQEYELATDNLPRIRRLDDRWQMHRVTSRHQFAVGMTSTALTDFMRAGKPAISYDPKGWASMTGLPIELFSYAVSEPAELGNRIRSIMGI